MEILREVFGTIGTMLICSIPLIIAIIHDIIKDIEVDKSWVCTYAMLLTVIFGAYISDKLFNL